MEAGPRGKRSSTHSTPSPASPDAAGSPAVLTLDVEAGALVPAPSTVQLAAASDMGTVLAELGRSLSLGDVKVRCTRSALPTSWQLSRLLHGARSSRCTIATSKSGARPRPFMTLAKTRGSASPPADRCRGRPRASLLRSPPRQAAIPSALSWRRWGCGRRRRWRTPTGRSASSPRGRPARPQPSRPPQALRRARSRAAWA